MGDRAEREQDERAEREQDERAEREQDERAPARSGRHPVVAGVDLFVAVLVVLGIWIALPARWWPVDVLGTLLAVLLAASGAGLLSGRPWGRTVALAVGWVALAAGLALTTALALTAAHIQGLYGPVGGGGAIILTVVALLVLPYLVALPAAKLWVLARPASER